MRILLPALSFTLLISSGCRSREIVRGVPDSTFVSTIVALRRVPQMVPADSGRRLAVRDSILRAHGVSREQLDAAARVLAQRPSRAKSVWDAIDTKSGVSGTSATTSAAVAPSVQTVPATPPIAVPPATPIAGGLAATPGKHPDSGAIAQPRNAIKMDAVGVNAAVPKKSPVKP